jgi:hypothetical protein
MYTQCGCEGLEEGRQIYAEGSFLIHACFETRRMAFGSMHDVPTPGIRSPPRCTRRVDAKGMVGGGEGESTRWEQFGFMHVLKPVECHLVPCVMFQTLGLGDHPDVHDVWM